jgi:hypothetical protein
MHLIRDVTHVFGQLADSLNVRRKLSLAIAFSALGLVASTSGIALLVAESDNDPLTAFALAPLSSASSRSASSRTELRAAAFVSEAPVAQTVLATKTDKAERVPAKTPDAVPPSTEKTPEIAPGVTELPIAPEAAVKSGSSVPVAAPVPIAAPAAAAQMASAPAPDESFSNTADSRPASAAPQAAPPPAPAAKPRKTARHESRRTSQYQRLSLWPFGGSARQRPFRLFW